MSEWIQLAAEMRQSEDGSEGEMIVNLDIPENVRYDVDDAGDGQLYVQYWRMEDDSR